MLSDLRYPIGILVGAFVGYLVFSGAPDLPPNGEIGFLGIMAIAHYVMLIGGMLVGIITAVLIIVVMKRRGASQQTPPLDQNDRAGRERNK